LANVTLQTGALSVIGTNTISGAYTLAIAGSGNYLVTGVGTVNVASGVTLSSLALNNIITGSGGTTTSGDTVIYTDTLRANNTATMTIGFASGVGSLTSGIDLVTINAGTIGDSITIVNSASVAGASSPTAAVVINAGNGGNTIRFATANTGVESLTVNVGNSFISQGSTVLANAFQVNGFTSNDTINIYGASNGLNGLVNANGSNLILTQNFVTAGSSTGVAGTNNLTGNFVSGANSLLTNLTAACTNASAYIFETALTGANTANVTTQAGINSAVNWIVGNVGTGGVGTQENAVLAIIDGSSGAGAGNTALFLYTNTTGQTSGIASTQLKLIGVLSGQSGIAANQFT